MLMFLISFLVFVAWWLITNRNTPKICILYITLIVDRKYAANRTKKIISTRSIGGKKSLIYIVFNDFLRMHLRSLWWLNKIICLLTEVPLVIFRYIKIIWRSKRKLYFVIVRGLETIRCANIVFLNIYFLIILDIQCRFFILQSWKSFLVWAYTLMKSFFQRNFLILNSFKIAALIIDDWFQMIQIALAFMMSQK